MCFISRVNIIAVQPEDVREKNEGEGTSGEIGHLKSILTVPPVRDSYPVTRPCPYIMVSVHTCVIGEQW